MDTRYEAYCLADPRYYDSPDRARSDNRHPPYRVELPADWQSSADGEWTLCAPGAGLPAQGWKIHVSATMDNAPEVLKKVSAYCMDRGIAFKHLSTASVLLARNAKYAPREASGKFLTIYPRDTTELHRALLELDDELSGSPGPYILSDLRWNGGPLYVRYGGFAERYTYTDDGILVPAVERPDGQLVPDPREPQFVVPSWVAVPGFLADAAARRADPVRPEEFPYEVIDVLHFSNGGGVYKVRRLVDGAELVLKEGRPHAGLDAWGRDAVARLRAEHAVLASLAGVAGVPQVHDYLAIGGHEFMVLDYLPGRSLHTWLAVHYPYVRKNDDGARDAAYLQSVRAIVAQLRRVVAEIHAKDYLIRDLHPDNILVDDDLRVSLIDFEMAVPVDSDDRQALGAPGFVAPGRLRGTDADRYSLAAVELYLYLPMNSLLWLCPEKAHTFVAHARARFHLDQRTTATLAGALRVPGRTSSALRPVAGSLESTSVSGPWNRQVDALVRSIRASATPHRRDRLFPGDIAQFEHGGGGFAFGAAGVIDTLHTAGYADLGRYLEWLVDHARRARLRRIGLYDGLAGICYALYRIGQTGTALELFDRCLDGTDEVRGAKLFDGLSGLGLTSLYLYCRTGATALLDHAEHAAHAVASAIDAGTYTVDGQTAGPDAARSRRRGNAVESFYGGLLYGWSGLALFMVRMYEVTEDRRWLAAALAAVGRDLDQCEDMPDGTLEMRNGGRVLPYLATGSGGVAIVADLVLRHLSDERLAQAVPRLCLSCTADICICGGLFNGRVGLVYTLWQLQDRLIWSDMADRIHAGIRSLDLYLLQDEHGLILPGEQNIRVSTDVATGSAGVLRLLNVLTGRSREVLPFLSPQPWRRGATAAAPPPIGPDDRGRR